MNAPLRTAPASPWLDAVGEPVAHTDLMARAAQSDAVLQGERHDRSDHHRWQLHVAAGLASHRPLVLGFEMFPASLNPVLAEWVAGDLSESDFLTRTDWQTVWGFPPEIYLPLFRFCREAAIPMIGLNLPRQLVHAVGARGREAVP